MLVRTRGSEQPLAPSRVQGYGVAGGRHAAPRRLLERVGELDQSRLGARRAGEADAVRLIAAD